MSSHSSSSPPAKWTTRKLRALKGERPIACLTCYDYSTAKLIDRAGVPLILVGDSLGMTMLGHSSTLPVTMEHMIHHTAAVARGVESALVLADLPFGSCPDPDTTLANATRLMKEAGAEAVKLEGGAEQAATIERLIHQGIPVCGHIGLTPQSVHQLGGYRVQGRGKEAAARLLDAAKALDDAGAFAIVLEAIPGDLAAEITAAVTVPTIGIGAGVGCDGQVLVLQDMLGVFDDFQPRFVRRFGEVGQAMTDAFTAFREAVEDRSFPADEHTY